MKMRDLRNNIEEKLLDLLNKKNDKSVRLLLNEVIKEELTKLSVKELLSLFNEEKYLILFDNQPLGEYGKTLKDSLAEVVGEFTEMVLWKKHGL